MRSQESNLVEATHLARKAYVYVRQSSPRQVAENTESTRRQYALRDRARALGWPSEHIDVIDCDQGISGTRVADRPGFQRLMSEVTMGRAGIVLSLEVSRLARNCSDWHRLVEVCAVTGTLLLDQDGLYDPTSVNHQLVLGIKGLLSAVEIGILRGRMREALLGKAARGELRIGLPVGFEYDEHGRVRLHSDGQVRRSIQLLFETFRRTGTAGATVRSFRDGALLFPRRAGRGIGTAAVVWKPLDMPTVVEILHNPRYAGAFAYGRRRTERLPTGGYRTHAVPREQWHALVRDAHEGYIDWDEFERNEQRLRRSALAYRLTNRKTPPREGPALLQGLVLCGVCGGRMTVHYHDRPTGLVPDYRCASGHMHARLPVCQIIPGASIDRAVGKRLVEAMTPMAIELTLAVRSQMQARLDEADQLRQMQVERARHEAESARRRYMLVDPDNRLVADTLEAEWNVTLRALARARDEAKRQRETDRATLDRGTEARVRALAEDFRAVFDDPATSHRDRKRMAQLLIEDATLLKSDRLHIHIRFKGGACESLTLPLPKSAWHQRLTHPDVVARVAELLEQVDETETAARLNAEGLLTGAGQPFDRASVRWVRYSHGLKSQADGLRQSGRLTVGEMATCLGLPARTVRTWARAGRLLGTQQGHQGTWFIHPLHEQPADIRELEQRHNDNIAPDPAAGDSTPPKSVARIDALLSEGQPGTVIAQQLNAEGYRSPLGSPFRLATVRRIREDYGLQTLGERLRQTGMLTTAEMAVHLGLGLKTVGNWARAGRLRGQRCGTATKTRWLFAPLDDQPEPIRQRVAQRATIPKSNGLLSAAATGQGAV